MENHNRIVIPKYVLCTAEILYDVYFKNCIMGLLLETCLCSYPPLAQLSEEVALIVAGEDLMDLQTLLLDICLDDVLFL